MLSTNTPASRYASIDDILGDSQKRFFGAGYRQVRQHVRDVRVDAGAAKSVHATASIVYPAAWSKKKDRELQPHLSSVDAIVIGAQMCDAYLRLTYGIEGPDADRVWLRRIVLKAGQTPTLDLAQVPSHCSLLKTEAVADSLCGHLSYFSGRVGTMGVELVFDHPVAETREAAGRCDDVANLLGPAEGRYFGSGYTAMRVMMRDVDLEPNGRGARTLLDLEPPPGAPPPRGMGAAYFPFVSGLMAIVSVAQLAQAMLYTYDSIDREASNNLWMRRIMITSPRPAAAGLQLPVYTWCRKTSLLPIKDALWRSANFGVTMPGIEGEYSLAHQLPRG
ncbi:MAG TPA: AvrD family protein [Polyangiaceae bacterium]|nr:AvrD family protein [Polyangiaceae bacterium]